MNTADLEEKLEAMTKNAFETGAMGMQTAAAKYLLSQDLPFAAEAIMNLPLPAYMPAKSRGRA